MANDGDRNQETGVAWPDVLALLFLFAAALALRAYPIGVVSLWWDELVQIQTASKSSFGEVLEQVRLGIPPGHGNAGAVPLDYLVLHGWLSITPEPPATWLETYYRLPSLLWSVLTVLLTYLYGRRFFDRGFAFVAATLLAVSVAHSLYAAEVRFYALFALTSLINLWAFSALVFGRDRLGPWVTFTVVALLYFATGLFGLLVLLNQYAILFVLLLIDVATHHGPQSRRERIRPLFPVLSGLVVLGAVAAYMKDTLLGARYGRAAANLDLWERMVSTIRFFADGNNWLIWAFAAGLVLVLVDGHRRGKNHFAIAVQLVVSFLAIPVIIEIERWKEYYFHPRHAFFLLPIFALVASAGILVVLRGFDPLRRFRLDQRSRNRIYVALACVLVVATQAGTIFDHLQPPHRRFGRTKHLRDFKSLAQDLEKRVAELEPGTVYLLVSDRRKAGHIGNPMLAKYLEWYGIDDRVVLRASDRPNSLRTRLRRACPDNCIGEPANEVHMKLRAPAPYSISKPIRELIEIPATTISKKPVGGVGLVHFWTFHDGPPLRAPGFETRRYTGFSFFEKSP